MKATLLTFRNGNAKLNSAILTFSLPAGHACPGAHLCFAKTVPVKGNRGGFGVKDGPHNKFRCFAATDEAMYPAVRNSRWNNFNLLKEAKTTEGMIDLILRSLPNSPFNVPIRLHVSGDFFSQAYFDAWLEVAKQRPNFLFYGYTKSLPYWIARLNDMPKNFRLVASLGGKYDNLITQYGLKCAKVVFSVEEAQKLGLEIDHDDSHAYSDGPSFALLLHGNQPAGTEAAKAWVHLKKEGIGGYNQQKEKRAAVIKGAIPKRGPEPAPVLLAA